MGLNSPAHSLQITEKKITFATLRVTRTPYVFSILLFRHLNAGQHKNE
jgi:hypothetical protein